MNILNLLFEKIYVISSFSTQDRISDLIQFLNNENIKYELVIAPKKKYFIPNYDKTTLNEGAQSLISVNESIFLKEYHLKSESFCIIEDDIYFDVDYIVKLNKFFADLPNDWEMLNLGHHDHSFITSKMAHDNLYYKVNNIEEIVGTHVVVYKKHIVKLLLELIENCIHPMDWFLTRNIYSNCNTYICVDKIFYASSYREYEFDKNKFYKKYKSAIF